MEDNRDHLWGTCEDGCRYCGEGSEFDWSAIELLCADAAWVEGSQRPGGAAKRSRGTPGRPPAEDPRKRAVSVALTHAEYLRLRNYATRRGVPLAAVLRSLALRQMGADGEGFAGGEEGASEDEDGNA